MQISVPGKASTILLTTKTLTDGSIQNPFGNIANEFSCASITREPQQMKRPIRRSDSDGNKLSESENPIIFEITSPIESTIPFQLSRIAKFLFHFSKLTRSVF
ncbi:hypothetical protein NPIL_690541 [Nephila pilipes]|uniref:Uncharacterized protein n=1 Tax=Nephila pilipes TaxID=299642 RepID=A0A8X6R4P2_NEPPI|nr:hypothetical protein NPIL_690541 [Nephila pilipes]